MAELPVVPVRLADGADSGLASIVQQYLEQDQAEFVRKRRLARRLRGRLAMTASDYGTAITVGFHGDDIAIWDGERPPLDARIVGPYSQLVALIQGETHPIIEHLRGRLRVRSSLRRPFLPLQAHSLMKLPPEAGERRGALAWALSAGAIAAALGGLTALALWLT